MRNMKYVWVGFIFRALLFGATHYNSADSLSRAWKPAVSTTSRSTARARRIYLSHGTQVDVVEADGGKVVGTIPDTPGVHGIAIASAFNMYSPATGGRTRSRCSIPPRCSSSRRSTLAGGRMASTTIPPRNVSSPTTTVRTMSPRSKPRQARWWARFKVDGDGEQAIIGSDGLILRHSENTAEVVAFDLQSLEVKKRWPSAWRRLRRGLAYDAKNKRLFIGCRE